jgi:hypothetical protein
LPVGYLNELEMPLTDLRHSANQLPSTVPHTRRRLCRPTRPSGLGGFLRRWPDGHPGHVGDMVSGIAPGTHHRSEERSFYTLHTQTYSSSALRGKGCSPCSPIAMRRQPSNQGPSNATYEPTYNQVSTTSPSKSPSESTPIQRAVGVLLFGASSARYGRTPEGVRKWAGPIWPRILLFFYIFEIYLNS